MEGDGSFMDAGLIACSCLIVYVCVCGGSVCGRHAYTVTGPAADSRATIGPDFYLGQEDTAGLDFQFRLHVYLL